MAILGDVRVGKTTLLRKCIEDKKNAKIIPTIAVEFGITTLCGSRIKFWDVCTCAMTQLVRKGLETLLRNTLKKWQL